MINTVDNIKVSLLAYTPNPEKIITAAAKLCYSKSEIDDLLKNQTNEAIAKFINKIMKVGHTSILEHATFTFGIENISRITEVQLVRKRTGSFSVQSGRYVMRDNVNYMMPPQIQKSDKAKLLYINSLEQSQKSYIDIISTLAKENPNKNIKSIIEDARYVQPQSLETRMIFSIDLKNLIDFIKQRKCKRAQWEIRHIAILMAKEIETILPNMTKYIGAPCEIGICPEGPMSCKQPYDRKGDN